MAYADYKDLLNKAREQFIEGNYNRAEDLLHQVLLVDNKVPEVYQMLATIFYDRGLFNKAINYFKKALEIDPQYTDASVGLSIILNDLGRYEEGQEVFKDAQTLLNTQKKKEKTDFIEDRLSLKHVELGDLYFNANIFEEALEQYMKALNLTADRPEIRIKMGQCYEKSGDYARAQKEYKTVLAEDPMSTAAMTRLAHLLQERQRPIEAQDYWERILNIDPTHREARNYIHGTV